MELYLTDIQPTAAIANVLETLKLGFVVHHVDKDQQAHHRLVALTGGADVPTITFDDGTYLVQPTPAQLSAKLQSARAVSGWKDNLLTGIAFGIGFLSFAIGVGVGIVQPIVAIGAIFLFLGVALLLVAFLPPLRKLLGRLSQLTLWKRLMWVIISLYAGLMGLAQASRSSISSTGLPLVTIALLTVGMAGLGLATHRRWQKSLKWLKTIYSRVGLVGLVGFLAALAISLLTGHVELIRFILLPQLVLFSVMLVLGTLQAASDRQNPSPIGRATLALFPSLGLLIIISILL